LAPADEDGEFVDWIEIWNGTDTTVNLAGWSLTNDPVNPQKWLFPSRNLGANAYLIVFLSGKDLTGSQLHANFTLQGSDYLGLFDASVPARLVTEFNPVPQVFERWSYAYFADITGSATKAAPNVEGGHEPTTPRTPEDKAVFAKVIVLDPGHGQFWYDDPNHQPGDAYPQDAGYSATTGLSHAGGAFDSALSGVAEYQATQLVAMQVMSEIQSLDSTITVILT
jgi:hypothetical protein